MTKRSLSAVALSTLVAACSGGGDGAGGLVEPGRTVASVTIGAPTTMIHVGEEVQLTATALDADGNVLEGQIFEWTSGIQTVASVSSTGVVTGRVKGRSRIQAIAEGMADSVIISVAAIRPPPDAPD